MEGVCMEGHCTTCNVGNMYNTVTLVAHLLWQKKKTQPRHCHQHTPVSA